MKPDQENRSERQDSTSSLLLLARAKSGNRDAIDRLVRRHLPALRRWAHGRLPRFAREVSDTDDLVQGTLMRALARLEHFEPRHTGAFSAYLRQILVHAIRDEIRKAKRRPGRDDLHEAIPDLSPTPLDQAVSSERMAGYERGLARLSEDQRAAVALRIELGLSFEEIGQLLGGRTANAARLLAVRGVKRLRRSPVTDQDES